ncbi:hypothetical protein ABT084_24370 [Streptomyces sp. NPDC002138]|uniref:hypothetical protein n=1 Tax=Streptomyces sp. NPDC002138 TaxID=3154410 RepID=UPI00331F4507
MNDGGHQHIDYFTEANVNGPALVRSVERPDVYVILNGGPLSIATGSSDTEKARPWNIGESNG